ncbi:MAG: SDR family oxidoreductase [Verrucomicrobiota bacterium]|nr:SDR family oxidoreductase [Verrucomicrobiota bacterium]
MGKSYRVLVAGGSGFLGSHLCERLINEGNRVICVDNFCTGREENLASLLQHPRFSLIRHDITAPIDVEVDAIYNLASPASPIHYQKDPIQTAKTSCLGALHLLELARRLGCKIFQASTSEVYGDPFLHPQPESYWGHVNPIGLRSCYDEGKRMAETLFFDYHRVHGVKIKVGRIFNTYGPRMDPQDGRVVSNFIVQALQDAAMTVYGKGEQTRSFCYVDDLIEAIVRFMKTPDFVTGPINLGNPTEYRVIDLAHQIVALTKSPSKILFCPLPSDDPKQRRPDINLAKQLLDWEPRVPLEQGLMHTINYFEREIKSPAFS